MHSPQFGIANPLANPVLQLFSGQTHIASNGDRMTGPSASQSSASWLAPSSSLEAAIRVTLNPGAYTAIVTGALGGTGIGSWKCLSSSKILPDGTKLPQGEKQ